MSELIERDEQESLRFSIKLNRQTTNLLAKNCTDKIETAPNIFGVENVKGIVYLDSHVKNYGNSLRTYKEKWYLPNEL